jgi:Putative auto-transporter adhesin, head GIN domain
VAKSSFRLLAVAGLGLAFAGAVAAQPTATAPAWRAYAADEVQLRDLAAIVRIVPEERRDIVARVTNSGSLPAPELRVSRGRLTIDGRTRRIQCDGEDEDFSVRIGGRGRVRAAALPHIELRVPTDLVISSEGAAQISVAPARSLRVHLVGCADGNFERVRDNADISIAGGGNVRVAEAGSAAVQVAGGGDVSLGAIRSGLDVSVAGSGDVLVARADGPTNIAIQGSGDVLIRTGRATTLTVAIAGSGDVAHLGSAERLDASVIGSGDVSVARVSGQVSRRVLGSGEILVAGR